MGILDGSPLLAGIPAADLRRDCPGARVAAIRLTGIILARFSGP